MNACAIYVLSIRCECAQKRRSPKKWERAESPANAREKERIFKQQINVEKIILQKSPSNETEERKKTKRKKPKTKNKKRKKFEYEK